MELIEAHMPGGGETKAKKYGLDDIHYWGVINWGFIATPKRIKKFIYWDNVWKNWCFYHYYAYLILTGQRTSPEERENWRYCKEIKKIHDSHQIAEKARRDMSWPPNYSPGNTKNGEGPPSHQKMWLLWKTINSNLISRHGHPS